MPWVYSLKPRQLHEGIPLEKPHGLQTPCKQLPFSGSGRGLLRPLLTRDFPCSMVTFLTDAPLDQLVALTTWDHFNLIFPAYLKLMTGFPSVYPEDVGVELLH